MRGMQDSVILLHGILLSRRSMARLARHLKRAGYRVLNMNYPSRRASIEQLVDIIHPEIAAFLADAPGPVHWVTHSMGGLLARAYVARYPVAQPGRLVMLGTPNQGSEVADKLRPYRLFRFAYGPAGQQLGTRAPFGATLGPVSGYEVGVIAGSRSIDPLSSYWIGQPNDGKVSIASTHIPGMADHLVMACSHTFMPMHPAVIRQVLHFLQTGRFAR